MLILYGAAMTLWIGAIALSIMDTYLALLPVTAPSLAPLILYPLLAVLLLSASFALFVLAAIFYHPLCAEKPLEDNKKISDSLPNQ